MPVYRVSYKNTLTDILRIVYLPLHLMQVAKINGIVETSKIYNIGTSRTNKGFKLQIGHSIRVYRFEFVSNQAFTDEEYQWWKDELSKNVIFILDIY